MAKFRKKPVVIEALQYGISAGPDAYTNDNAQACIAFGKGAIRPRMTQGAPPVIPTEPRCRMCEEKDKLLARIAAIVASQPTVTGLQSACVNDYSLIPMAIRDAQDTFRDTLKRTRREEKSR